MAKPKVLVFIPAYRCAPQIVRVLNQFNGPTKNLVDEVLVVDNRSPDTTQTAAIEASKLITVPVAVWENAGNYGLGGSHKVAFQYAKAHGFDYLVVLHGDDQGSIDDARGVLERLGQDSEWDCMLGARFHPHSRISGYSKFRTFGNHVYDLIFSVATGTRIYDLGSGLNIYKVSSLDHVPWQKLPDDLTFNYGMLLSSLSRKWKVRFFPISWREDDQLSNVKLFSQALKVLKILALYVVSPKKFPERELRQKQIADYSGRVVFKNDPGISGQVPN